MQDEELLSQFEACTLAKEHFKHINHLRIAWLYLSKYPLEHASNCVTQGIIRYAASIGAAHIYNETLTRTWVMLVYNAINVNTTSFEQLIQLNPKLLDKNYPYCYYSKSLLDSETAHKQWLPPDLKALTN